MPAIPVLVSVYSVLQRQLWRRLSVPGCGGAPSQVDTFSLLLLIYNRVAAPPRYTSIDLERRQAGLSCFVCFRIFCSAALCAVCPFSAAVRPVAAMDVPEPEQTPFTAVTTQTSKLARVSLPYLRLWTEI